MERILLRSPNWLGDGVMAFPTVEALKGLFPGAEISVMTRRYLRGLWSLNPWVHRIWEVGPGKLEELRVALALRKEGFDLYISFPRSFLAALTGFLTGARRRVGYLAEGRGWLLTDGVREDGTRVHRVRRYLRLLEPLGGGQEVPRPRLTVSDDLMEWAGEEVGEGSVALNPGATYGEAKCWPGERFAELGRELIKRGARVVLLGGPGEVERNRWIARAMGSGCLDLTGRTTIGQLAAVLKSCRCLVTNDTGPMHLAAAVGTPVVALFGSTDPELTGPVGEGHRVIWKGLPCSPCFRRECPDGHHRCMKEIGVGEVLRTLLDSIND